MEQKVKDYLASCKNGTEIHDLVQMIHKLTGEQPQMFQSGSFTGIGFSNFHYVCSTYDGPWPKISIAQQKNYIALYLMPMDLTTYIPHKYPGKFTKSQLGKSCLRITNYSKTDQKVLEDIILTAHQTKI